MKLARIFINYSTEAATGDVLKNLGKLTGKHVCQNLFFDKVTGLRVATLFKKRLRSRCFPVNFANFYVYIFYRTPPDNCF